MKVITRVGPYIIYFEIYVSTDRRRVDAGLRNTRERKFNLRRSR